MKVMTGIAFAALILSGGAMADNVYKCRALNGKTVYSGIPCEGNGQVMKTYTGSSGVGKSAASPSSSGSKPASRPAAAKPASPPVSKTRTVRCTSNFAGGSDCEYAK